jgi:hypothetical protein
MIDPSAFLPDHVRNLREGESIDDDLIRGACPGQAAIPWLPAMLGCQLRILPESILAEERRLSLSEAAAAGIDKDGEWFQRYVEYLEALAGASAGRFPVGHTPELGPSDLHGVLRGHTESILDLADNPDASAALLTSMAEIFVEFFVETWKRLPRWQGGFFDAQYSLWSPRPIIRMQEDATAAYSPALYRRLLQPADRMIARRFPCSFVHLHSTSMFLLDAFLEIEEIACFEINNDALGPPISRMIPHFRKVQSAGKPLLIRGALTSDELRALLDSLESRGLFLNIMVKSADEAESLRPILGMA